MYYGHSFNIKYNLTKFLLSVAITLVMMWQLIIKIVFNTMQFFKN